MASPARLCLCCSIMGEGEVLSRADARSAKHSPQYEVRIVHRSATRQLGSRSECFKAETSVKASPQHHPINRYKPIALDCRDSGQSRTMNASRAPEAQSPESRMPNPQTPQTP